MAFSSVASASVQGLHVEIIHVEADVSNGLPMFHMVGYLSSEVKEAAERVCTAIRNSGIQLPPKKTVINLSPATVKKKGASYDLPIALSVLEATGMIPQGALADKLVIGELGLDGCIRKAPGILPIVMEAKKQGYRECILPGGNVSEGELVSGMRIIGIDQLTEIREYLRGVRTPNRKSVDKSSLNAVYSVDFSDIYGQSTVKRAAEVAVAGGHNLLMIGPPGSGKSMIAKRIPTIFPPMSLEESIEVTKIYSVMGKLDEAHPLIVTRPYQSVHHTATKSALIGGGVIPVPGLVSLSHGGALFLDELAEFQKPVLEVLREPMEDRCVKLARSSGQYEFPANFMLIAAMNPCPCGHYPNMEKCSCTEAQIRGYLGHISQPFLDRIDICTEAPRIAFEDLKQHSGGETSEVIRERVCIAREIQKKRYEGTGMITNAMLSVQALQSYCVLGEKEECLLKRAFVSLELTARTYHKILKVARTIADLDGEETIQERHLKEAISYRMIDKKYWGR